MLGCCNNYVMIREERMWPVERRSGGGVNQWEMGGVIS